MTTFAAVTTFHAKGYALYGREMIATFDQHWPKEIPLYCYAEGCVPEVPSTRILPLDLMAESPSLVAFKERHADVPEANGAGRWDAIRFSLKLKPFRLKRYDIVQGPDFHWDAVRFSHKCFAIFAAAKRCEADVLFWLDADISFFEDLPPDFLEALIREDSLASFLQRWRDRPEFSVEIVPSKRRLRLVNRTRKHSECGFVAYDLRKPATSDFLDAFEKLYTSDAIFREWETHDSYLFDVVRRRFERKGHRFHDLGEGVGRSTSHPLVNCQLGQYMDHKKGNRKEAGRSFDDDLLGGRPEKYWTPPSAGAP
jgi:hypothetical protein